MKIFFFFSAILITQSSGLTFFRSKFTGGDNLVFFGSNFNDQVITTLNYNFASLLNTVYFSNSKPTFVYVHGFNNNYYSAPNTEVFNAYFTRTGYNIIAVDWKQYGQGPSYPEAASTLDDQGKFIANILNQMKTAGFNLTTFHFAGHSMGAQLLGRIATALITTYNFTPTRITGLDPANVQFDCSSNNWPVTGGLVPSYPCLTKIHANFVDIIHTDAGWIGKNAVVGHIDVWVNNNGNTQPKCSANIFSSDRCNSAYDDCLYCSHNRAPKYYAESAIRTAASPGFIGKKCPGTTYTSTACTGATISMGFYADLNAGNPGNYFVATKTNGIPPYSVQ